ncbi:MAG: Holliday junction branch migration protein RuvA [Bacillota bacterium]
MIAHLRGELVAATADSVILDVGGVGYRCLVPSSTRNRLPAAGQSLHLYTSLQVREDSMTLYGFLTPGEYELFELLLRVDGVGPKVALGVLSATTPDSFRRAVAFEDITALCRLPGIGKKTAQRMVLDLKEKVGHVGQGAGAEPVGLAGVVGGGPEGDVFAEAMEALTALGYSRVEAGQALDRARREAGEAPAVETLVRLSLKHLFRG